MSEYVYMYVSIYINIKSMGLYWENSLICF